MGVNKRLIESAKKNIEDLGLRAKAVKRLEDQEKKFESWAREREEKFKDLLK